MKLVKQCFECGSTDNLVEHHIIPRSLGGKKTVSLCQMHHDKIHGMDMPRDISISQLTKEGIARAKSRGAKFGNPSFENALKAAKDRNIQQKNAHALKAFEMIKTKMPASYNKLADYLNESSLKGRRGGKWTATAVRRILLNPEIAKYIS